MIIIFQLCRNLTEKDVAKTFKTSKQHDKNAEKIEGMAEFEAVKIVKIFFLLVRRYGNQAHGPE